MLLRCLSLIFCAVKMHVQILYNYFYPTILQGEKQAITLDITFRDKNKYLIVISCDNLTVLYNRGYVLSPRYVKSLLTFNILIVADLQISKAVMFRL